MSRPWTKDDLALLQRDDMTIRDMSIELGRSYNSVAIKRRRLGLLPLPFDSNESRKTHCPKGHEYSGDNLQITPQGNRRCLACLRERNRHIRRGCKRCAENVPHEFNHGTATGYNYHSCRCIECKQWFRDTSQRGYWSNRERNLEHKRRQRERNLEAHRERERAKRSKPETKAAVSRRREKMARVPVTRSRKWMPHERALVLREDLSVLELAYMLERSPSSIQAQRGWLRRADEIRERNRAWREKNWHWYYEERCAREGVVHRGERTHCKRGHQYDEENTYWHNGTRYCKACRLIHKPLKGPRAKPTHCPQGHPYEGDNLRLYGNRYQRCMECDRQNHRKDVCKYGHEFTPENTKYCSGPSGRELRRCIACDIEKQKTHCPAGHKYTPENTYTNAAGYRMCRACRLDAKRRYNAKLKEKAA